MFWRELVKPGPLCGFRSLKEWSGKVISGPSVRAPLSHSKYTRCVFDKTVVARMCEVRQGRVDAYPHRRRTLYVSRLRSGTTL